MADIWFADWSSQCEKRVPYRHPQPADSPPEIVIPDALPADERLWVPQAENVWFRPLCLSASRGYWMNLLRVRKSGVLSRHRHPQPVHGYVIRGRWRYLEHDWVATEGSYVYEAPGETHTLGRRRRRGRDDHHVPGERRDDLCRP
jgi:hypothetical protein